jgi:hypothetical protein
MAPPPLPNPHLILADKAELLGNDKRKMESYELFQTGKRGWFFSPNPNLAGAKKRPGKIASWDVFSKSLLNMGDKAAKVIADLAGLPDNKLSVASWPNLKRAYDGWPSDRHAVFQASGGGEDYLCNVFAGDVLYLAGKSRMLDGGKYYGAAQFYKGNVPGCVLVEQKRVARGDIASWDFGAHNHVEIVTKVNRDKGFIWDTNEFCSRGAGRSGEEQGVEKCGGSARQLTASNIKFYRLK